MTAHFDWLPRIEFEVNYPLEKVWPFIVRWERWVGGSHYQIRTLSGERGVIGERLELTQNSIGEKSSNFSLELLQIIEHQQVLMKLLPLTEPMGPIEAVTGYEIFTVQARGDQTKVVYQTIAVLTSSALSQTEFADFCEAQQREGSKLWDLEFIPQLNQLLSAS